MTTRPSPALIPLALGVPLAASALLSLVRDAVPAPDAVLVLVLVVVAVATGGSRAAGLLAALSSAVWFDFFLTEPYLRFAISDRDDVETAVLLSVVGIGVTEIALWGRRRQADAGRSEGYLSGVVSAAGMVAAGEATQRVVLDFVRAQIVDVLGVDRCDYAAGAPSGAHPVLGRDGVVRRGGRSVDVERSGLPTDDIVELAVERGGASLGRFVITAASSVSWPSLAQRRVAVTLAEQAASALASARSGPHPA